MVLSIMAACAGDTGLPDTVDATFMDSAVELAGDSGSIDASVDVPPILPAWPVINEVAPGGTPDDWFEVYNGTGVEVDLSGFSFTDSLGSRKNVAAFPAGIIVAPGGFAVVRFSEGWPGFGLGPDEELGLIGPGGELIDGVDWNAASAPAGHSLARLPDGSGSFMKTACVTPGSANRAGVCEMPLPSDFLFSDDEIATVDITLSEESIAGLWNDSHTYVPGQVRIVAGGFDSGLLDAGVKLKGRYGSFSTLDGKSAFKVKLDFNKPGFRLLGLDVLNLNNFQQDCSMIHEHLAYGLFRAFGVPALRTGWALVNINGVPYGVYLLLERYDEEFFRRWYPTTDHVYEGAYGNDLFPEGEGAFEVSEGAVDQRSDLKRLIEIAGNPDDATWIDRLKDVADLDEMLRMWAVEQYIGHWDGYAATINNYYLRSDDSGRFTMHPWGLDQTWADFRDYHSGYGMLFARCMAIAGCRARYDRTLGDLLEVVDSLDLEGRAASLSGFITPYAEDDGRKSCGWSTEWGEQVGAFIRWRRSDAGLAVQCAIDPATDHDGDGVACMEDCNDSDMTIHPGAVEMCFDWVDQDCSGIADDGPGCPDCRAVDIGNRRYVFCRGPRSRDDAMVACADNGSGPLRLETRGELVNLMPYASYFGISEFWLPVNDRFEEGAWAWDDGSVVSWTAWAERQPDDGGGVEDCVEVLSDGTWNDLDCSRALPVVCEDPCEGPLDDDNDGHSACSDDCDDGNSVIFTGADDVCGDWLDQDCDGLIDGRPDCYGPYDVPIDVSTGGGARFIIHVVPADATTASRICSMYGIGASLAWFDSLEQETAVTGALRPYFDQNEYWFGLNDRAAEGSYVWPAATSPSYLNWAADQPNNNGGWQNCVRMTFEDRWNDTACGDAYTFMCRVDGI